MLYHGIGAERRRIQIEQARECIRQNVGTENGGNDEVTPGLAEEVGLVGDQNAQMDEEEKLRLRRKWVCGRKLAKNRNPFTKAECDFSNRAGEEKEDDWRVSTSCTLCTQWYYLPRISCTPKCSLTSNFSLTLDQPTLAA